MRSIFVVAFVAALLTPPAVGSADGPMLHHVHMANLAFSPDALEVALGDTVEWHNHDAVTHTATDGAGAWDTGDVGAGATRSISFGAAAPHEYLCIYHAQIGMEGSLDVIAPNEAPTVAFTSPLPASTLEGAAAIAGSALDPDGNVALVEVRVDNADWQAASGTTSWTFDWDTLAVVDGEHALEARATDDDGATSATASLALVVANPPGVRITSPALGIEVDGIIEIAGTAADTGVGTVSSVEVRVDEGPWREAAGTATWTLAWDSSEVADGSHTLEARSFDGGLFSPVAAVSVVTDNFHADLVVPSLEIEGDLLEQRILAAVRNVGDEAATAFEVTLHYETAQGSKGIATFALAALDIGEDAVLQATWDTTGKLGGFPVVAVADPANEVEEHDEGDNERETVACVPDALDVGLTCGLPRVELDP